MANSKQNLQVKKPTKLIADTIRSLSMDAIQAANSGHPGLPLGMADVAAVLWNKFLKFNPKNPNWENRDRFVLSGGHGSMLLYSLLHLFGYDLPLSEIKNFRQWESKTPGHPEYMETPGVETTTGPLGQGIANAVGMALAEKSLAARFNKKKQKIVDHFTYVMLGDGDLEEGISHEACSLAGHNKLGKLIAFYDSNDITIDGPTSLSFSEKIKSRMKSYGWHVIKIDGHNYSAIKTAIKTAQAETDLPTMIICKTIIGYGSPNKAGTSSAHGSPLGVEEIVLTKKALDIPNKLFYVPKEAKSTAKEKKISGKQLEAEWKKLFKAYKNNNKELAATYKACMTGSDIDNVILPRFKAGDSMATRASSGKVLDAIIPQLPSLMGGSADLTPSNKTFAKGMTAFSHKNPKGNYIHYGVREHGMAAIMNGLSLHGGIVPYAGTFFVFADYMRPAIRMAALMGIQVIHVLTHDSIGLGEDGPTHQPIAQLASLRAMPNVQVLRPMDAGETAIAWKMALKKKDGPSCLVLTRQSLPEYSRRSLGMAPVSRAVNGGYILIEDEGFNSIILATGSEVEIALNAKEILNKKGMKVRIVSMPSTDVFDSRTKAYKEKVLPSNITNRVAVEAGATQSWYKYVGLNGRVVGIDRYGASAPFEILYKELGITPSAVAKAVIDSSK